VGIAQLVEHRTVAPAVAGSIPVSHPNFKETVKLSVVVFLPGVATDLSLKGLRGPVAQLDRASDFGSEGWGFDSLRGRHLFSSFSELPNESMARRLGMR
jgi:hypothetical protein